MSRPVRIAPATGPGTRPSSPSAGRQNVVKAIHNSGLDIEKMMLEPLAAAEAALSPSICRRLAATLLEPGRAAARPVARAGGREGVVGTSR